MVSKKLPKEWSMRLNKQLNSIQCYVDVDKAEVEIVSIDGGAHMLKLTLDGGCVLSAYLVESIRDVEWTMSRLSYVVEHQRVVKEVKNEQ